RAVRVAAGAPQATGHRGGLLAGDVLDVAAAVLDGRDLPDVRVEPDHVAIGLGERDREGQAHVPQAYDSDLHWRQGSRADGLPPDPHVDSGPIAARGDNRPVEVGVVGPGYWGPNLARNFHHLPEP